MRRRSADAAAAPRPVMIGAARRTPTVTAATAAAAAAGMTVTPGASPPSKDGVGGGVDGGSVHHSYSPSAGGGIVEKAPVKAPAAEPAAEVGTPSTTRQLSSSSSSARSEAADGSDEKNSFPETRGNDGGRPLWSGAKSSVKGGGGGLGGTRFGSMSRVPEEDEDMSLTIGTGSKVFFPAAATAAVAAAGDDAIADGRRGSDSFRAPTASRTTDRAAAPQGSGAVVPQRGEGGGEAKGGDLTLPLGSEKTDTSDQGSSASSGAAGVGNGDVNSNSSGLFGGGCSTGGSVLGVGTAGKPDKVRQD